MSAVERPTAGRLTISVIRLRLPRRRARRVHGGARSRRDRRSTSSHTRSRRWPPASRRSSSPGCPSCWQRPGHGGRLTFTTDICRRGPGRGPLRLRGHAAEAWRERGRPQPTSTRRWSQLLDVIKPGDVVVGKSTVPVGTAERLAALARRGRAGGPRSSGTPSSSARATPSRTRSTPTDRLRRRRPGDPAEASARPCSTRSTPRCDRRRIPLLVTDYATAQLVKVAANSFLATKISFINAMAELCEAAGGDVTQLADAIGMDARIGRQFLNAGLGFGGGCLPKDIRAFMARAGELGVDQALTFLREVDSINMRRRVPDGRPGPRGVRRLDRRPADRGARCRVQAGERRRARLAGARRGGADAAAGRARRRHRPAGHPQRAAKWPDLPSRRRSRRPLDTPSWCCCSPSGSKYRGAGSRRAPRTIVRAAPDPGRPQLPRRRGLARSAGWTYRALGRR